MALALISVNLLKREIKELSEADHLDNQQVFYLSVAKKELQLLEKLNIECNMQGTEQEVMDRYSSQVLWLLTPDEREKYIKAYKFYLELQKFSHVYGNIQCV